MAFFIILYQFYGQFNSHHLRCREKCFFSPQDLNITRNHHLISKRWSNRLDVSCLPAEMVTKICTDSGHWFLHPESNRTWTNFTRCNEHTKEGRMVGPFIFHWSSNHMQHVDIRKIKSMQTVLRGLLEKQINENGASSGEAGCHHCSERSSVGKWCRIKGWWVNSSHYVPTFSGDQQHPLGNLIIIFPLSISCSDEPLNF